MKHSSSAPDPATSRPSSAPENTHPRSQLELAQKIGALTDLSAQQLRDEWRRLYRGQPPRLSRDLLIRAVAYRMQELVYGGLSKATQRKLLTLTKELKANGMAVDPSPRLKPGARLVREWRGGTHTVVVTQDGFDYARQSYPSLTKIAHAITGAHWSGPRFFGLTRSEALGESKLNASSTYSQGEGGDE